MLFNEVASDNNSPQFSRTPFSMLANLNSTVVRNVLILFLNLQISHLFFSGSLGLF